jgi:hypothetical protein
MEVTLGQAMQLTRLRREGLSLPELADRMCISVGAVIEVHRALLLPMPSTNEAPIPSRDDAARAAERERWPMKWQQSEAEPRRLSVCSRHYQ